MRQSRVGDDVTRDGVRACRAVAREARTIRTGAPSLFELRGGSLRSLRYDRPGAGLPSGSSRSEAEAAFNHDGPAFALRRGSLRSLRYDRARLACRAVAREASEGWWAL